MKKVLICIIVICIIIIMLMGIKISKMNQISTQLENKIEGKNGTSEIVKNEISNVDTINEIEKNETSNQKTKNEFDASKMKISADGAEYELREDDVDNNLGVIIEVKNGKAYVSTDTTNEFFEDLFGNVQEVSNQEITGFSANVVDAIYCKFGQSASAPIIVFLMDDGTVEYVDSLQMLKNKNYKSAGKITELKDITNFAYVDVTEREGSGYISIVAIDQDGYAYDLCEILDV